MIAEPSARRHPHARCPPTDFRLPRGRRGSIEGAGPASPDARRPRGDAAWPRAHPGRPRTGPTWRGSTPTMPTAFVRA